MILVDSGIWIDYFRGVHSEHTNRLDALLGQDEVAIGDLILTEVLQGFLSDRAFETARRALDALPLIRIVDADIALRAARHYRTLRALGVTPRKTIDTLIATRCIADDLTLLHNDRDFNPFIIHLGLRSAFPPRGAR